MDNVQKYNICTLVTVLEWITICAYPVEGTQNKAREPPKQIPPSDSKSGDLN
jgi:hypothetical protein